jgi:rubredoxin
VRRAGGELIRMNTTPHDRRNDVPRELPGPGTRYECKICWHVYDPVEGDPLVWQVAPGTPFADLPPHWTCPNCSATQDQFLVLPDD